MMKILCLNCRSAYRMVALKGSKNVENTERVTVRCPVCCDHLAYTLHERPKSDVEKDQLRVIMLHDHLWPRVEMSCARARQDKKKALVCIDCKHYGVIDKGYCELAKKYCDILVSNAKVDEEQEDEPQPQSASAQLAQLDYAMPDEDET